MYKKSALFTVMIYVSENNFNKYCTFLDIFYGNTNTDMTCFG